MFVDSWVLQGNINWLQGFVHRRGEGVFVDALKVGAGYLLSMHLIVFFVYTYTCVYTFIFICAVSKIYLHIYIYVFRMYIFSTPNYKVSAVS